ncbi:MAG: carbamate kinase [Ignavibacteriae bacterium]|nr:carbamate kinase [Ignavibacteriota bacterium]
MSQSLCIAVGGNSLIRAGQKGTIPEQFANAHLAAAGIAELAARGYHLVVTHGNGPQVGAQLLRSEAGSAQTYSLPLDMCDAMTQGEIGYIMQNSLQSNLRERGINLPVATIVTQVMVDKNDPAFQRPTKPIGPFYSKEIADKKEKELGWNIVEDAARGYRRVVPSPKPRGIIELEAIRTCVDNGILVIACGGGGIPVISEDGQITGKEAVIDKDRASALLASLLKLKRFLISTEVEQVYLNFKKPNQQAIKLMTVTEAKQHLADGHFAEGSMKPKIEAAVEFIESGGDDAIITDPEHLVAAVDGNAGTRIVREQ